MRWLVLISVMAAAACDDAPPAGTSNLAAPTQPVFLTSGDQELLAFIDQGHDAVRLLDLTAGTYQWGENPYFPRAVRFDDSPIDLAWTGDQLVALSASGQAYAVALELAPPVSLALAAVEASAHPLGLVSLGEHWARLDSDCTLTALSGPVPTPVAGLSACQLLGDGYGVATQADQQVLVRASASGLVIVGTPPWVPVSAHAAADGGAWMLSSDRRRLLKVDDQGAELLRFVLPFTVMDLVETADDTGPLLALVGLNTGVLYLRADGVAEVPHGNRAFTRPIALAGSFSGLEVRRDEAEALVGRDLMLVGGLALGDRSLAVAAVEGGFSLTAAEGEALPDEALAWVDLTLDDQTCAGRMNAESVLVVETGECPVGDAVQARFLSSAWHAFTGTALAPNQIFDPAQSLGAVSVASELAIDGHVISATTPSTRTSAVVALRGQTGLGSTVLGDGWFSGITSAVAKTNYSDTAQPWLWLTSPSDDTVVQLPLKSSEYYQILLFR